ncbi:DUF4335 domain-containing protein [Coleofasciculus chthonoplastes]|uniref:DUF4335 domain-containing protein n=1 Tax=Coleofasciculus chthonoplastes TaxID=64178 RepID=UPI0032FE8074
MIMPSSVLRRYTPPTCTLAIVAKTSPLSRWVGKSVVKDLRFELHFDDPRQPEEKLVTIKGDRTELDVLYEAVSHYIQNFLNTSPQPLPWTKLTSSVQPDNLEESESNTPETASPISLVTSAQPSENQESELPSTKLQPLKPWTLPLGITLQPKGLVTHELVLGQLANEDSGSVVYLSVLQLFDLATALDDYAAEILALPNLNRAGKAKVLPLWTKAAAIVVLAVGVTTAGVRWFNQSQLTQETASLSSASDAPEEVPSNLAQELPTPTPSPLPSPPSPIPTPTVPPSLANAPTVPPPKPVKPPAPSTRSSSPEPAPQRREIAITPPPQRPPAQPAPSTPASPSTPLPTQPSRPPAPTGNVPKSRSSTQVPATPPPLPVFPPLDVTPATPELPNVRSSPSVTARRPSLPTDTEIESTELDDTNDAARGRLFDTIPQVAQARTYLQQRWQPPEDLTKVLEYRLFIAPDGSIERIIPLGQASQVHIEKTGIPLVGKPFVSPIQGDKNPTIRVVLNPDGQVETFLEEMQ